MISFLDLWALKMGPIGCPETSVRNYQYSLRNIPEERSSQENIIFVLNPIVVLRRMFSDLHLYHLYGDIYVGLMFYQ